MVISSLERRVYDAIDHVLRQLPDGELEQLRAYVTRLSEEGMTEAFAPVGYTSRGSQARSAVVIGQVSRQIGIRANVLIVALYEQVALTQSAAPCQEPPSFLLAGA